MKKISIFDARKNKFELKILQSKQNYFLNKGIEISLEEVDQLDLRRIPKTENAFYLADVNESAPEIARCSTLSIDVDQVLASDFLIWERNQWTPRLLLKNAIRESLAADGKSVDARLQVFILAEGAMCRLFAGLAIELGYSRIQLIGKSAEGMEPEKKQILTKYMGVQIGCLQLHELTLQKTEASLLFNSINLEAEKDLASDLAYFNFMSSQGVYLDISNSQLSIQIQEEARKAKLRTIAPALIFEKWEQMLLSRLDPKIKT